MPEFRVTLKVQMVVEADDLPQALDACLSATETPGCAVVDGEASLIRIPSRRPKWWRRSRALRLDEILPP